MSPYAEFLHGGDSLHTCPPLRDWRAVTWAPGSVAENFTEGEKEVTLFNQLPRTREAVAVTLRLKAQKLKGRDATIVLVPSYEPPVGLLLRLQNFLSRTREESAAVRSTELLGALFPKKTTGPSCCSCSAMLALLCCSRMMPLMLPLFPGQE